MKLLVTCVQAALFILVIAGIYLGSHIGTMPGVPAQSGRSDRPVDITPSSTPISCLATWSVVTSPNTATGQDLFHGIASVSSNDVWAVGSSGPFTGSVTLREHWDGNAWSVVPGPDAGITSSLGSVAALSTTDIWAVGYYYDSTGYQPLIEHWDG